MSTMDDILEKIENAERQNQANQACWEEEERRAKEESRLRDRDAKNAFLGKCRPASPAEYAEWLHGYLKAGGSISHVYNYDMPADFLVATKSCHVTQLFGSRAKNVIVPKGIDVTVAGQPSHNNVYWMDGFKKFRDFVPLYRNVGVIIRSLAS